MERCGPSVLHFAMVRLDRDIAVSLWPRTAVGYHAVVHEADHLDDRMVAASSVPPGRATASVPSESNRPEVQEKGDGVPHLIGGRSIVAQHGEVALRCGRAADEIGRSQHCQGGPGRAEVAVAERGPGDREVKHDEAGPVSTLGTRSDG